MYQKILVAVDNSEMDQHILAESLDLATATVAQIMLLHVISPLEDPYISPIFLQPDTAYPAWQAESANEYFQYWEKLQQERLDWLRSLSDIATGRGLKAEFAQHIGDAGRIICELAGTWPADLVIVGRRGRAGLSELFLGSVSNYVLHRAPCSVLAIQGTIVATSH